MFTHKSHYKNVVDLLKSIQMKIDKTHINCLKKNL